MLGGKGGIEARFHRGSKGAEIIKEFLQSH